MPPRPRSGSRKAHVFDFFLEHSLEETITFGVSLGLAAGTIRSWAGGWKKSKVPTAKKEGSKLPGKIYVTWDPDVPATVIYEGPEVSEVRFEDGRLRFINNDHIRKVETKEH